MNKLIWHRDYTRGDADMSDWNVRLGNDLVDDEGNFITYGWGNNEQQFYTGNNDNLYIDENGLNLCARLETVEQPDGRRFAYTSARIDTRDRMSFRYGKLVVRAKLPVGHGVWPAIWMLPQDKVYGNWPVSGEIDVMEAKGRLPRQVFGTLHHGKDMAENKITDEFSHTFESGTINQFRDYGLEWTEDVMRWTVDGHCFAERRLQPGVTPFDQRFYLVLNLAIGGWFDNVPIEESALPAVMTVSEIRVYQ
ncbi:glycoside hydrolase family 16 protein [Cohnella sp. GCM10027633]|uniref:glycoside hydrolase family 16 protein n=1 Tax=unclassified Cohnella TaxID=2636738 RepID=UPI0036404FC0